MVKRSSSINSNIPKKFDPNNEEETVDQKQKYSGTNPDINTTTTKKMKPLVRSEGISHSKKI